MKIRLKLAPGNEGEGRSLRWLPFATSLSLHAFMLCAIWFLPPIPDHLWRSDELKVTRLIEPDPANKPRKIIWLRRKERLPDISPAPAKAEPPASNADPTKFLVRANPPNAKHSDQFIFVPIPKVEEQKPIPAPNVVMTDMASVPAPPKPETKKFVPPQDRPREIQPSQLVVPEVTLAQQPGAPRLPDALAKQTFPKPAPKPFVPPPEKPREVAIRLVDAPEGLPLQSNIPGDSRLTAVTGQINAPKPAARKFVPPAELQGKGGLGGGKEGNGAGQTITAPDVPDTGGFSGVPGPISAVIISNNPLTNGTLIPPLGNRAAKVESGSAGAGGKGSDTGQPSSSGVIVPGVTVRGGGSADGGGVIAKNTMPAGPAAGAAMTPTRPQYQPGLSTRTVSVPQWPNTRRVPAQVEEVFRTRVVYSTVIPGPSGMPDLVAWFGETESATTGARPLMRPPLAEMTAMASSVTSMAEPGKCWIIARLNRNGRITGIKVLPGSGGGQAQELAGELEKWQFVPAIRNGEAVDVDIVLEVELKRRSRP